MPDKTNEWLETWFKTQQNFWQSWADMAKQGMQNNTKNYMPDWSQGLDKWWQTVAPKTSDPVRDMFERVVDMGKQFANLGETAFSNDKDQNPNELVTNWLENMEQAFTNWANFLETGAQQEHEMPDWLGLNKSAIKSWDEIADKLGAGLDLTMQMPGFENTKAQFMEFLNTPALGQWREHQHQLQAIARLSLKYHEAELAYKSAFAKMGTRSVEALRQRLLKNKEEISTLRDFYNLWVEANEEVYGKFAMTDEYQVVYGDMVNSLMALKKEINSLNEKIYKTLNLPTRSELNTVHQRLQEQRRENKRLRKELYDLKATVDNLTQTKPRRKSPKPKTDDLSKIKGIGPKMQEKLNAHGIYKFSDIANMKRQELAALDKAIGARGKVLNDNWASQAAKLTA